MSKGVTPLELEYPGTSLRTERPSGVSIAGRNAQRHLLTGFTLIEISLVVAMMLILTTIAAISLVNRQTTSSLSTAVTTFITNARLQQTKAMVGSGAVTVPIIHGIHFNSGDYILFSGSVYSPSDSGNIPIALPENIQVSTTFPGSDLLFSPGSGEISGFSAGTSTVTLTHSTTSRSSTLRFNQSGVSYEID